MMAIEFGAMIVFGSLGIIGTVAWILVYRLNKS